MVDFNYGKQRSDGQYEHYPSDIRPEYWAPLRDEYIHVKCGVLTRMGIDLAKTWATNRGYYGSTYCAGCKTHLPVSEFVWCERGKRTAVKLGEESGTPGQDLTAHGSGK